MNVTFDPRDDFPQIADGTETLTLHRAGAGPTIVVTGALRRAVERREAEASGGRIVETDVRWHLSIALLGDPPAIGDLLVDADGTAWTALDVRAETASSRWACLARNLAVVHGLTERVDVERASWTKDAAGVPVPHWHVWRAGLRCRIQTHVVEICVAGGQRQAVSGFRAYVTDELNLDQDCRLMGASGQTYRIVGWHPAEKVGSLSMIELVAEPEAVSAAA